MEFASANTHMAKKLLVEFNVLDVQQIRIFLEGNIVEAYHSDLEGQHFLGEREIPLVLHPRLTQIQRFEHCMEQGVNLEKLVTEIMIETIRNSREYDMAITEKCVVYLDAVTQEMVSRPYEGLFQKLKPQQTTNEVLEQSVSEEEMLLEAKNSYDEVVLWSTSGVDEFQSEEVISLYSKVKETMVEMVQDDVFLVNPRLFLIELSKKTQTVFNFSTFFKAAQYELKNHN